MNNELIGDTTVETAIRQFEMQAILFASRFTKDAAVRGDYMRKTKKMSEQLLTTYKSGNISAKQAATATHQMRNEIMEFSRISSS